MKNCKCQNCKCERKAPLDPFKTEEFKALSPAGKFLFRLRRAFFETLSMY